jgi:V-type H+-transporting ATPase subunit C
LKVGTLDTLLGLSDDLAKLDQIVEAVQRKITRQLLELVGDQKKLELRADDKPVDNYPRTFQWKPDRYPDSYTIPQLVDQIKKEVARTEDQMKTRFTEVNALRSAVDQQKRKTSGTLLVRSLADIVQPEFVESTEHLVTVFVVVPQSRKTEFENSYEMFVKMWIVPRSGHCHTDDSELALYSVIMFKDVVGDFKSACRERKYTVREYDAADPAEARGDSRESLSTDLKDREKRLGQWCRHNFSETYIAWMHLKAIRAFVESVLRFGLPPSYCTVVLIPNRKHEKKLRAELETMFGRLRAEYSMHTEEDGEDEPVVSGGVAVVQTTFYPYVYLEINLDLLS